LLTLQFPQRFIKLDSTAMVQKTKDGNTPQIFFKVSNRSPLRNRSQHLNLGNMTKNGA
jgi:hypothetical protein